MENLRICRNCLKEKSILFFLKKKNSEGRVSHSTLCHDCENDKRREKYHLKDKHNPRYLEVRKKYRELNKEKQRNWSRISGQRNKVQYLLRANKQREKKQLWFWNQVKPVCAYCGYSKNRAALVFHHLERGEKAHVRDSLSKWVRKISFDALKEKVINTTFAILCANCHAELHSDNRVEIEGYISVMGRLHKAGDPL